MIALLLKASIIIAILLAFYKFFLEKESFYATNRIYLLTCLILPFVLPLISLPQLIEEQGFITEFIEHYTGSVDQEEILNVDVKNNIDFETVDKENSLKSPSFSKKETLDSDSELIAADTKIKTEQAAVEKAQKASAKTGILFWIFMLYIFGVIIFALNFFFQIGAVILKLIRNRDKIEDFDCVIVNSPAMTEPCSFFKYIFINPESYNYETYEQILSHEKIHVKQYHTFDLLLSEIAVIILWFNPLIWLYRKEVEKNIEYQTDNLLLDNQEVEPALYQMNLLKVATYSKPLTITTNYNQSLIKQRIIKMSSKKSNPHSYWKYAFIAPMLFAILLLLSKPSLTVAQTLSENTKVNNKSMDSVYNNHTDSECRMLMNAIEAQDIQKVKQLLERVNANCIDSKVEDKVERMGSSLLVTKKARTPLILAASIGNLEIGKLLIEAKADPNFHDPNNDTPLKTASSNGDFDFVKLLVENGAVVDLVSKSEKYAVTPLFSAIRSDHVEMVKYLTSNGANINKKIRGVGTPLLIASEANHLELVKYLFSKDAKIDETVHGVGTPLLVAARNGHLGVVKYLVEKGAKVDTVVKGVGTPLSNAEQEGHSGIVEYLKSQGAKQ